ncbi:MAG: hypothetical protein LBQ64_06175, partial [Bacteroidales bacterium]|nr:hypothetical protein [Bacteroidales bacterium]
MRKIIFFIVFCAGVMISLHAQTVRYVTQSGAGNRSGTSWSDASDDIQLMIDDVEQQGGGQVWVAKGTYRPSHHYGGIRNLQLVYPSPPYPGPYYHDIGLPFDAVREQSFVLKKDVEVYGGFAGWESNLSQRDWIINETFLDGQISDNARCYHVVMSVGDVRNACLDGFIIQGGYAFVVKPLPFPYDPEDPPMYDTDFGNNILVAATQGGGIMINASSPRLENLIVKYNEVNTHGGAISMSNSFSKLRNIEIHDNESGHHGGGMFINAS